MNTWMTKELDMSSARDIIHKHMEEDEDAVGLQELYIVEEGTVEIARSHWVIELEEWFENKYGDLKGYAIAQKVITELLIQNEGVH